MQIRPYLRRAGRLGLLPLICLSLRAAQAGSATWNLNPTSGDWNTAANWTPNTVPNGLTDIATFDTSSITQVSNQKLIVLASINFAPNASVFTISISDGGELEIGSGIENNSGAVQNFEVDGLPLGAPMLFFNSATAGTLTNYTVGGSVIYFRDTSSADNATFNNNNSVGGGEEFDDESSAGNAVFTNNDQGGVGFYYSSTAGHATFIDNPGEHSPAGGETGFHFSSNAGESTIINNGSTTNISGFGCATFEDSSNAADATIINNGSSVEEGTGGMTVFTLDSGAGNSTLIANGGTNGGGGGTIQFKLSSTGETSRVQVFGNGSLSIVGHYAAGVAIGSLEGDGLVFLGNLNLSVGSSNLSTVFSGLIQGSSEGQQGALTKIGSGALMLTGANTYTGGTTIEGGNLVVNNRTGSATGTGPVQFNAGRLGGPGIIAGSVVVGNGSGPGAALVPRRRGGRPHTLTIEGQLTFNSDGIYRCGVNTERARAAQVRANGVVINGAQFSLLDCCGLSLIPGTVLRVIDNTSADPISGTFANLPDGGTITVGNNTFQASYTGGDGNDLTLTVVP